LDQVELNGAKLHAEMPVVERLPMAKLGAKPTSVRVANFMFYIQSAFLVQVLPF
jgi:hypothetical protein